MLKFPGILKDFGHDVRWSSGLIGRRPAGLFKKTMNFHVFRRSLPCVSQLSRGASICCLQGVAALHRATDLPFPFALNLTYRPLTLAMRSGKHRKWREELMRALVANRG